jgi:hypothetical protein
MHNKEDLALYVRKRPRQRLPIVIRERANVSDNLTLCLYQLIKAGHRELTCIFWPFL